MNTKEKRLLFEYIKLHEPIWEMTEFSGSGKHGMYRFWAYPSSTWSDDRENRIAVCRYAGWKWEHDSYASWEVVQNIVDKHRAGKVLNDLSKGLTRTVPDIIWSC